MARKIKKKWPKILAILVYLLGIFYLALPEPTIPHLPDSLKSTEPGDTWQIPGVWAYYTHFSRRESVDFFKKAFSRSSFLRIPLPTYVLNHPPEYARETIRDTQKSNFYEELVHPLRESLFISGWIPAEDPIHLAQSKDPEIHFLIEGQRYPAKITLYHVTSPVWVRLVVWTGVMAVAILIVNYLSSVIASLWPKEKR